LNPAYLKSWILLALLFLVSGLSAQTIAITELNYNSDSSTSGGDWVELHNFGGFSVNMDGWYLQDQNPLNRYDFPAGLSIESGEYLVVSLDITRFTARYPGVNVVGTDSIFGFSNNGDQVRIFNSSSSLVISMTYEDTVPWPKGADGHGRTLEVKDMMADPNDPQNWFDGCMFGSPGRAFSTCDPELVFSEVMYNPPLAPDPDDWIEIWNRSGSSIDLSGWILKDRRDTNAYIIDPGTVLGANEYVVLSRNELSFSGVYSVPSQGDWGFNLSGDGEVIRLFDESETMVFSMVFNDQFPFPTEADGLGYTLELLDPQGRYNEGQNWFAGCLLGSPGGPFDPTGVDCLATHAGNIIQSNDLFDYQLSGNLLGIRSSCAEMLSFQLFDMQGRLVQAFQLAALDQQLLEMPQLTGVYILEARSEREHQVLKLPVLY
jgi:hypothetical protein